MMCETMANVPVEEKSSYVLTEDMIDAAMNEQFAYQEDLESEEEESLPEEHVDPNSQESCGAGNERTVENNVLTTNPTVNIKSNVSANTKPVKMNISPPSSPNSNNNEVSVLVIETGLDKNGSDFIKTVKEKPIVKNSNDSLNSVTDVHNTTDSDSTKTVSHCIADSKADLTILKSMLSVNNDRESIIDLCESEADDFSEEDDANETETIDDELSSVMETNLMAEIGITMNKKTDNHNHDAVKASENIVPRISVKNISQISAQAFDSLPQNGCDASLPLPEVPVTKKIINKIIENQCVRNINFAQRNPSNNSNIPITANNQGSGAIHLNKIAVPHSSFVNSQGQRMKCVYVKSTSTLPFVINTPTQTTATNMNTNVKYVMTQPIQQVKKQVQMPAIAALKNLTKNIQPQTLLLKNNTKVLMAQKLQRPPTLQSSPRSNAKKDAPGTGAAFDAIKNSLIYSSANKKTHVPPDIFPEYPVFKCLDCNDKFLFKSSLANHIERRTMNIHYWCPCCKYELHFYNKCSLWIHLRGHSALRHFDPKHLTITPISRDMLQKGIVSSYFKTELNASQSGGPNSFQKLTLHGIATQLNSLGPNSADSKRKIVSIGTSNATNNKITTVAGQSKSVCFQSVTSSEISRPVSSPVSNTQSSTKILPLLLPKPPNPVKTVALVSTKSLPNHEKETTASSTKTPPKSLIVFCNKLPPAPNAQQISVASPITPNVVSEAEPNPSSLPTAIDNNDTAMVIDDDVAVVPNNAEEEEIDVENVDGNVTNTVGETEKSISDKGTKNTSNSSQSGSNKRTCSECKVYSVNISKHLNGTGRPLNVNLACKICNLILPSKCALKIHHRIHMKISPYKCPDCGKDFTTWDDLHAHLKFSCGHFAKCVRFICKGCKAHFPSQNGLAQHIVKNHGKDIFKCSLCPVAFYKKHSLDKHIETDHQNEKNKSKLGLDYKQCEMCPKKLLPEESYLVHAKEHSHTMIYGYKCSMCNIVYANKMAFIIHQIKEKTKRDQENIGKPVQSKTVVHEEPMEETLQVSDSSSDYEDEPVIIRKYPQAEDGSFVTEKDPLSLDDWECTQEQKVKEKTEELCIVCKKNSVVLLPGIDRNRQSSCCKECVKPLDDDSSTVLSKGSRKNGNSYFKSNNSRQSNPKSIIYRSSSTDEVKKAVKKRRISDISLKSPFENDATDPLADSPTRKKNRKKQKSKPGSKGQTHIQGQVIRSRSLDEFSHKCSKCEFVTENRESFLEHITVHRNDPNTYQCLECGLCFVVLPSLERHLQMHHGITDARSYTENNEASLPQKSVPIEEETQDNQCRVCYEIFDCQSSLDKHFRIHGMAFMSRLSKSP